MRDLEREYNTVSAEYVSNRVICVVRIVSRQADLRMIGGL